jgi:uncharacterized protein (DUF433 family)
MTAQGKLVVRDLEIMSGTPAFAGTRVPFDTLFVYLSSGDSLDTFLDHFPSVSRQQALNALELSKNLILANVE